MAVITCKPNVAVEIYFKIDEAEARALDALVGYGDDAFILAFKEKLGADYLRDHEDGLRRFFKTIRGFMPQYLDRANAARDAFHK